MSVSNTAEQRPSDAWFGTGVFLDNSGLLQVAAACRPICGVVSAMCVVHAADKRGIKIIYPLMGILFLFKYLPQIFNLRPADRRSAFMGLADFPGKA